MNMPPIEFAEFLREKSPGISILIGEPQFRAFKEGPLYITFINGIKHIDGIDTITPIPINSIVDQICQAFDLRLKGANKNG